MIFTSIEQPDAFGSAWSLALDFRLVLQSPILKWFRLANR